METIGNINIELGETANGFCYKNLDAYEQNKGICYIPELGINDANSTNILSTYYTRKDIEKLVRNEIKRQGYKATKRRVKNEAYYIFETCDWQCVETLLNETNFDFSD